MSPRDAEFANLRSADDVLKLLPISARLLRILVGDGLDGLLADLHKRRLIRERQCDLTGATMIVPVLREWGAKAPADRSNVASLRPGSRWGWGHTSQTVPPARRRVA